VSPRSLAAERRADAAAKTVRVQEKFSINFHPDLTELIKEAVYLDRLG
jgi:hypothetical protein